MHEAKADPAPSSFVRSLRKIYNRAGFSKGYNALLYFVFAGALLGFSLARTPYLDINGTFLNSNKPGNSAAPGEAYWYRQKFYNIGIHLHLLAIIPTCLLLVVQFLPIIRYKLLLFHRINGYVILLLLCVSNAGALMIARRSFGGTMATQAGVGFGAIVTTVSAALAYINIKRLRIDLHRAWMLRCWFYAGSIITMRVLLISSSSIISMIGSYYMAMPCRQIEGSGGNATKYPSCRENPNGWAAVHADIQDPKGIEEVAAGFQLTFGMAMWVSFALHAVGVEVYLHCTSAETERLRQVSLERRIERGLTEKE